ncbi:hypothetical protein HDU92_000353 [Lobulomyces angularis]|nr:hypothetical protein HDU92_000353 [Lobulomyces angularis]
MIFDQQTLSTVSVVKTITRNTNKLVQNPENIEEILPKYSEKQILNEKDLPTTHTDKIEKTKKRFNIPIDFAQRLL